MTTKGGLLVAGVLIDVPGLRIDNPHTAPWAKLDPNDYRRRRPSTWVRAIVLHTTKGIHPQFIRPGSGPGNSDKVVADFWRRDPEHSGAHIVVDTDGSAACLADLAYACAYHATVSNEWSIGIEMYQLADGGIFEATLASTVAIARAICDAMSIPFQVVGDRYANKPLARLVNGGPDVAGIYGHRENTSRRGRGDPGDAIYSELELAGAERFALDKGEDLAAWRSRQAKLNAMGERLTVDGIAGTPTIAAMRRHGFASGRDLDAAVEVQ